MTRMTCAIAAYRVFFLPFGNASRVSCSYAARLAEQIQMTLARFITCHYGHMGLGYLPACIPRSKFQPLG